MHQDVQPKAAIDKLITLPGGLATEESKMSEAAFLQFGDRCEAEGSAK